MRYFIHLSYDGSGYHGWQIQPSGKSIEEELERCLSLLFRRDIDIVGAGRTDAGVHARHAVAHFDVTTEESQSAVMHNLVFRLNRMLPPDIVVKLIEPVSDEMHARFSAKWRTYHYYVTTRPTPFNRQYFWHAYTWTDSKGERHPLDFQLMNEAAAMLLEYKDFAAFCKTHTDVKTTLCDVVDARWVPLPQTISVAQAPVPDTLPLSAVAQASNLDTSQPTDWVFIIKANRFLRNMVRAVVGTLVEVGRHRMTPAQFREVIEGKSRSNAGDSMPANALFLQKIEYAHSLIQN